MFGLEKLFANKTDLKKLASEGAVILDVRTPVEFAEGHIKGAVNVPVDQLRNSFGVLKDKTVITCCRSGARSAIAANLLKNAGITAINGGPWQSLSKKIA